MARKAYEQADGHAMFSRFLGEHARMEEHLEGRKLAPGVKREGMETG